MRMTLLLLLLPLAACDELQQVLPTVAFDRFDVRDVNFTRADADFVFAVDNPNPIDVQLSSFSYELGFAEVPILSGDNEEGFGLEALDATELVLPVGLLWADAWSLVQATRGQDDIPFALAGHFGFDTPLGEARLGYDEGGQFPALRTPKFRFQRLRVAKLDVLAQEARLELDLGVDNDHASTLGFLDVGYDVALAGASVAKGSIPSLGAVDGATEGTLTLPLTVDLTRVGVAVVDALVTRSPLTVGLDADMNVDTPFGVVPLTVFESGSTRVE